MRNTAYIAVIAFALHLTFGCATSKDQQAGQPSPSFTSSDLLGWIFGADCSDDLSKNNPNRVR
jgi:hypothetical protein